MDTRISERLKKLPPYLFVEIDRLKRQAREAGRDIIDLGIGDPDEPTPGFIIDALCDAARGPANHRYALDQGSPAFRKAVSGWYKSRFNVSLNPDGEILPLIGSKEGIAHLPLAFINPGETALVPDPCYPPYKGGTIFAGGELYLMPLLEENLFLPDLKKIPKAVVEKARLIYVNYPNNPTAATADAGFYKSVIEFAKKNNIIVVSDLAYSEVAYDGYRPQSILEIEGARAVAIEFHSLSKTFNMTGWRIGWACGDPSLVSALAAVKSNVDSGIFNAIQMAGAVALGRAGDVTAKMNALYQERRDLLVNGLNSMGWKVQRPKATFYVWCKVPKGRDSIGLSQRLLKQADIVVTPGEGFGPSGKGFIRMALTVSKERLSEALKRMERAI